ncbi:MAG: CidA/LrgA family protein [Burkholderiales bacterium]
MLQALAALLLCQLVGEFASQLLALAIPGPVIGMALLFSAIQLRPKLAEKLRETATAVLQHLSLLFVPAGVGVMLHAQRVAEEWVAIVLAVTVGTLITIAVTALTIKACFRLLGTSAYRGAKR